MKATPSQQASLTDLWKNKAPKKKKEEEKTKAQSTEISSMKGGQMPPAVISTDSKVMDMDVDGRSSPPPESSQACRPCPTQGGGLRLRICEYIQLPPIPKDLQSEKHPHPSVRTKVDLPPYQPFHMVDYILLDEEQIVKRVVKKRKVITSDNEDLPDDGLATMPSKIPKKEKKKLSRAQAKLTGKSASQALETSSKKVLVVEPTEDGAVDDVVSDEEELAAASTT